MSNYQGHILTDDLVVNYKKRDRDDCLHFLTHIDTSCHELASFVSPTAKRIYTSIFNAWFLKINFNVKHIDVQGFQTNKSYKITYKGNKYIYSFIDSKFSTGSVALLLHGDFGTYLYTGNFCYYPSFIKSPVLQPVIEKKALTRLYLDNTYYEQPSDFLGFEEIASNVAELIKSERNKDFYIYADKVTMDPLIAEIASKLEEKVYICQSTMEIMKFLGYDSCFTRHSYESRIFINKTLIKQRDFENGNIVVYLNRFSDPCKSFKKIERQGGGVYNFNFYCHCSHKEICELLKILDPKAIPFIFSKVDKSKRCFETKSGFPSSSKFNGVSTKPSTSTEVLKNKAVKNNTVQLNQPTISNNTPGIRKKVGGKRVIIIPKSRKFINLNTNNGDSNHAQNAPENQDVTRMNSMEHRCPLRVRKVPEINRTGLSKEINCPKEDSINKSAERNSSGINFNNSNDIKNSDKNPSLSNVQLNSSSESFHNHHNPEPKQSLNLMKLQDNNSAGKLLIPSNMKSLSTCIVQTKTGKPLVFNPNLVKENRLNSINSKIMQISNIGMVSDGNKKTIVVKRKYVDVSKPYLITVPPDNAESIKLDHVENEKHVKKDSNSLSRSQSCDTNPSHSNISEVSCGSHDSNSVSETNDSSQISVISLDEVEEIISSESEISDRDGSQLEASVNFNNKVVTDSDSFIDLTDVQLDCAIDQPSQTLGGLQSNPENINENNSNINSNITILEKNIENSNAVGGSPCKVTNDLELEPILKNSEKNIENNCQHNSEDNYNITSKRCLFDGDNEQSRKKLRSDNLIQSLLQSNRQKEPLPLRNCSVLIRRNDFKRSYFYSPENDCYLPKFCGFKKHEVRPRTMLISLRNLQKLLDS